MEELHFPILLGRDAPAFHHLLATASMDDGELALPIDEEDPGEGPTATRDPVNDGGGRDPSSSDETPPVLSTDPAFQWAQGSRSIVEPPAERIGRGGGSGKGPSPGAADTPDRMDKGGVVESR